MDKPFDVKQFPVNTTVCYCSKPLWATVSWWHYKGSMHCPTVLRSIFLVSRQAFMLQPKFSLLVFYRDLIFTSPFKSKTWCLIQFSWRESPGSQGLNSRPRTWTTSSIWPSAWTYYFNISSPSLDSWILREHVNGQHSCLTQTALPRPVVFLQPIDDKLTLRSLLISSCKRSFHLSRLSSTSVQ